MALVDIRIAVLGIWAVLRVAAQDYYGKRVDAFQVGCCLFGFGAIAALRTVGYGITRDASLFYRAELDLVWCGRTGWSWGFPLWKWLGQSVEWRWLRWLSWLRT